MNARFGTRVNSWELPDLDEVGIHVDLDDVQSIQQINGATIVRMKDGSILTSPSRRHSMDFGEMVVYNALARRIRDNPLFDMSKPLGLKLPSA